MDAKNENLTTCYEAQAFGKMTIPFFSIIVPVYNVAPYLRECLDSVLAQTYPNWECLCVNDGSTDESGAILDEYAQKDSRFRVFHKKNGGVSAARNLALDNARGVWVLFLDSDDLLASSCLLEVRNHLTDEISWLSFNAQTLTLEGNLWEVCRTRESWEITTENVQNVLQDAGVVWGNCFQRKWLNDSRLRFDTKLKVAEDSLFIAKAWIFALRICHRGDIFGYYYRLPFGRGSLMEREAHLYWDCRLLCLKKLIELNRVDNIIWQQVCNAWIYQVYLASLSLPLSLWQLYQKLRTNSIVRYSDIKQLKLSGKNWLASLFWLVPQKGWRYFLLWFLMRKSIAIRYMLMKHFKFLLERLNDR